MEHRIIPFEEHKLPIDQVDSHALFVTEKLQDAGFVTYLVGGCVRDLLLGHRPKDFDISTSAKPEEIKQLFRNCLLIGRRFRLAHIRFGKKVFEVSTFRAGDPETEELILRDNEWGYPEEDALRRDFTINGLFYDPSNQTIIDYIDGYRDIKRKYIRTIGQPFARFKQDPVRMLRLLKFQARFNLEVDPDAHINMLECRTEIIKSSQARVLEEILRMLESGHSKSFIELLSQHGLLSHLIPEVAHFIEKDKNGSDIYEYLHEVDTFILENNDKKLDRSVLLASLAYPLIEKRIDTHFTQREKIPHLGQIQDHCRTSLSSIFNEYFHIPRRLKVGLHNILVGQFRLTPLHKRRIQRHRIPKDCDFGLALQFLLFRSRLEPGLQEIFERWQGAYDRHVETQPAETRSRTRRPRRRRGRTRSQ